MRVCLGAYNWGQQCQLLCHLFILLPRLILDFLLPPRCPLCKTQVMTQGYLCGGCWARVRFYAGAHCACCGLPFPYEVGEGAQCGRCLEKQQDFDKARFLVAYESGARELILKFKHGDATHLSMLFACWTHQRQPSLIESSDLIAPVPLHPLRLLSRKYNQAALFAQALGAIAGRKKVCNRLLRRTRNTPPQENKTREQRYENIRGSFQVPKAQVGRLKGAHVLLVDDVMTSGATANGCAQALKQAGARKVSVLTIGRVVSTLNAFQELPRNSLGLRHDGCSGIISP